MGIFCGGILLCRDDIFLCMERRDFLAGTLATLGHTSLLHSLPTVAALQQASTAAPATSPQNLLTATYPAAFLAQNLLAPGDWHPYPRWQQRDAWQGLPQDIRAVILQKAEKNKAAGWNAVLATTFLEFQRNGNRSNYENQDFGRRTQLQNLVLAECIEGNGRFLDDIANGIWLICEESFWGVPAHLGAQKAGVGLPDVTEPIIELFGAETVALLAWTHYLLGDQLDKVSPLIRKRIVIESERRQLEPARRRNDFVWMGLDGANRHLNNWNPWINSNLLVANFLLEQDATLRLQLTSKIIRSLDAYLNQYWPDGGCEEGPGYFSRSPMSYFECVSLIESVTGNRTKIFAHPFLDSMGRYILNTHICGESYINYGDAHVHAAPDGNVLYRYGKAVGDADLTGFGALLASRDGVTSTGLPLSGSQNVNLTGLSRNLPALMQAAEIRTARRDDPMVRDVWYPYLGLMAAREKSGATQGMYLAMQAANNGRSHSHNDSGSFILYHDCDPVAIDVGVETYTAQTFSAHRYDIWTMQSAYHNLPTVGGVMQHDGANFKASDVVYKSTEQSASLSCNLATAYPKEAGIHQWLRSVTLNRGNGTMSVQEKFSLASAQEISISIMTPRVPTITSNGDVLLQPTIKDGKPVILKIRDAQLTATIETIPLKDAGMRSSWGPQIYRLLLKSKQPVTDGNWLYEFHSV